LYVATIYEAFNLFTAWKNFSIFAFLLTMCLTHTAVHAAERLPQKGIVPLSGKLRISGSSTMAPMMTAAGRRFSTRHPGVQIEVRTSSTGQGIDDVTKGNADIGMASRALTDKESVLYSFAIARDGVCLIVHKNNPVQNLTNRQVFEIFTGKVNNWSKVGGNVAPIMPINAKEGFGSVELFTNFFSFRYADIKAEIVVSANPDRVKAIIANPNGIVYTSVGSAQQEMVAGAPIKLIAINGVAATAKNIRNGNYPMSRPLLLMTKEIPSGLAKAFISFSLSSQNSDIVLQHDFVPYLD